MNAKELFEIADVEQHSRFEKFLRTLLNNEKGREIFYDKYLERGGDLRIDCFREYFEEYNAERKTHKQDYTPTTVADLLACLAEPIGGCYDGAAGTGALIIAAWNRAVDKEEFRVTATEYADNSIPYLLHNLAIRNMQGVVNHGDTLTGETHKVYTLKKGEKYSRIEERTLQNDEQS